MSSLRPITIIGGGLAGLSLGIALRRRDVPVTLWEAVKYPRHRVCGEFLCGRGLEILKKSGLIKLLESEGAIPARTAAFYSPTRASPIRQLPSSALCLSRYRMDAALAGEFKRLGGELREQHRWRENFSGEGRVRANGRRIHNMVKGWRWFGLKAHAVGVTLEADLELHLTSHGYVGLCRIEGDKVNVCGLFWKREPPAGLASEWKEYLRGREGSLLRRRLNQAEFFENSFSSTAGLCFLPRRDEPSDECRIGDALNLIPPFTGNGMSMAIECAEQALDPLTEYSTRKTDWVTARESVQRNCVRAFSRRLFWSRIVQGAAQRFHLGPLLIQCLVSSAWLWKQSFVRTR